jgi:quercetin dioxygenase-like cupin family protein
MQSSGGFMLKKSFVAALILGSVVTAFAQAPAFKRTVLQTVETSIAGRDAVTAKAELPAGVSSGLHTHPGEELGYLVEGTATLLMDGKSTVVKAGEAFAIPAGKVHSATNTGTGMATIVSTYIVERGKPLATPAK